MWNFRSCLRGGSVGRWTRFRVLFGENLPQTLNPHQHAGTPTREIKALQRLDNLLSGGARLQSFPHMILDVTLALDPRYAGAKSHDDAKAPHFRGKSPFSGKGMIVEVMHCECSIPIVIHDKFVLRKHVSVDPELIFLHFFSIHCGFHSLS